MPYDEDVWSDAVQNKTLKEKVRKLKGTTVTAPNAGATTDDQKFQKVMNQINTGQQALKKK